ncbi:conserved hypothetical protein [Desulfamplus magnetovallimortis]|uniref:Cys-tRNA(Pro)/Cys-tRNA(Cys) deacylase n=1 Tax=Desulfamplus magnetovallimortis TaxID=1246637 RepID=A0A1W1HGH3_9BACT|nr:Cys-tRNA(Pro) deacylase [Desulfamplus magnetovallimortis]SLM31560.1 conserved hypothetical protein [Desulfamplus magnetovallimortis]
MTPAVKFAKKAKIPFEIHKYSHDPSSGAYGLEAAQKMGVDQSRVFKTLVVNFDGQRLAVGIVPVSLKLDMKLMAKAAGAKKAVMADGADVERSTGYVLGGVSPLGQKRRLLTILDISAKEFPTIYVSAGRRGLEIELDPEDLIRLVNGEYAAICQ